MLANKSKKILVAIIIVFSLCMVGCKDDKTPNVGEGENDSERIDNRSKIEENKIYEPTQEILDAKPEEGKVQICDKVYTLPIKYSELKNDTNLAIDTKENIKEGMRLDKAENALKVRINGSKVYLAIGAKEPNNVYTLDDAYIYGIHYFGEETRSDGEKGDLLDRKSKKLVIFAGGITVLSDVVTTKENYKYKVEDRKRGYLYCLSSGEELKYEFNEKGDLEEEEDNTINYMGVYIPITDYINPNW